MYRVTDRLRAVVDQLPAIDQISALLGLLGTVIGMVKVFTAITASGVGNPTVLAGGIAEALITTAAGLTVAIPALIGHRYYRNRVDTLVVNMEKEVIKLVEALDRRQETNDSTGADHPLRDYRNGHHAGTFLDVAAKEGDS